MRSKRERKQRSNGQKTSKRKAAALSNALDSFAPDNLRDSTPEPPSQGEDTNVLILETKAKKPASEAAPETTVAPTKRLSKSQKRKLKKIQEDKAKRAERAQVLKTLASNELSKEELALLQSSAMIGQTPTKRQKLRHALACQRLGLEAPDSAQLEVERPVASEDVMAERPHVDDHAAHQAMGMPEGSASDDDAGLISEDEDITEGQTAELPASMSLAEQRQLAHSIRQEMGLPPDEDLETQKERLASHAQAGPTRVVAVRRSEQIQESRAGLPVLGMEQEIMEAITGNDVCLLCGETGSGKTTQVPQFLYEAGYGSKQFPERAGQIGVTQPRRVAAIAAARRVAEELNCSVGGAVGYQVRYDRQVSGDTAMKFMTDGILLRELQSDLLLRSYSVLVLDEAHERSLNTDLLLGLLSRVVPLRKQMAEQGGEVPPLKLVIMSATLRVEDFAGNTKLFPAPPPIIRVPARQYPVTVHFCRRTELYDYVGAAFGKVVQIHERLSPGGILVFVTGQREVEHLCTRLRAKYAKSHHAPSDAAVRPEALSNAAAQPGLGQKVNDESLDPVGGFGADEAEQHAEIEAPLQAATDDYDAEEALEEEEETATLGGDQFTPEQIAVAEAAFNQAQGNGAPTEGGDVKGKPGPERAEPVPMHVLPLYAMLPGGSQDAVFRAVPSGHRLIIVATNVAETSLTIPGIRYVVDAGRAKEKVLDSHGAAARFQVTWISKASAEQRAGRAGRTGPGHCYRLYSSAHFNDSFPQHSDPEVLKTPLEGVALIMKAMGIDKVLNFPFPTAPDRDALAAAERTLCALGALDNDGALTERGRAMAALPLDPRPSRMILQAAEDSLAKKRSEATVSAAVALAAVVSGESPFIHIDSIQAREGEGDEKLKSRKQAARAAHRRLCLAQSDALNALSAFIQWLSATNKEDFCRQHYLHAKNLREAAALHSQLLRQLAGSVLLPGIALPRSPPAPELPSQKVLLLLQRAIAAGWADQVARRVHSLEYVQGHAETTAGRTRAVRYMPQALAENVFLHPQSALTKAAPEFVVYTQILRTEKRPYLAGVTEVEARWLPEVAEPLIRLSGPLEDPTPHYSASADAVVTMHSATFGQHEWPVPAQERPCADAALLARHFAAALLDGAVLPSMTVLRNRLVASPASAAAPYSQGQKRIALLVHALASAQVFSRAALARAFAQDPAFLKEELQAWLLKDAREALASIWPTLLLEAHSAARKKGSQHVGKRKHSVTR